MPFDVATVASLVGALGVGSVLGQWLSGGRDRRAARAAVLDALREVETARWAPAKPEKPTFVQATRELETAALLARIPRKYVRFYLHVADAAHTLSQQSWDDYPDEEDGGGAISAVFADAVREAARLVTDVTWSPYVLRVRYPVRLARLDKTMNAIEDQQVKREIERARSYAL